MILVVRSLELAHPFRTAGPKHPPYHWNQSSLIHISSTAVRRIYM
jgi:hypothetical protein